MLGVSADLRYPGAGLVKGRALLGAFAVALLGGLLLLTYVRHFEQEASGGPKVPLLVALKPIEPGSVLTEEMLGIRLVPQAYVEQRAIHQKERANVVGLRVALPVLPQATLQWTDLAVTADDRRDLSSLVQPGMRAVGVRTGFDEKTFALIRPGDRVDVIATMPKPETEQLRTSVVLLQNVLVLAVGTDTAAESSTRARDDTRDLVLSLSLHVPEAQLLALATEKGKITVALRNPDDTRTTEGLTDLTSAALLSEDQRRNVREQARGRDLPIRLPTARITP